MAYERIRVVNPEAVVLAGALTPTVAMDGRNMNDLIYLQRMYNAGAGACFDVMSAQGYGLWSGAADQRLRRRHGQLPAKHPTAHWPQDVICFLYHPT